MPVKPIIHYSSPTLVTEMYHLPLVQLGTLAVRVNSQAINLWICSLGNASARHTQQHRKTWTSIHAPSRNEFALPTYW